ncbi:MAG: LON peptidase substrate-binding domain-containing protein [Acidobacteriota bacterium]|nr:LON peptidase substrate-binding domain-containing protein [Acidobacteriota bacterium]
MKRLLLPLFPLQVVLLPGTPLPLHVFEERYKEMIADVMGASSEFGVVLSGDKGICNMGCTAAIEKVLEKYPDGRMDLLTVGRRRFEILELDNEKPYLRGEVSFFDDDDFEATPEETRRRVLDSYNVIQHMGEQDGAAEPDPDHPQVSFQFARSISDLNFRQLLLSTRSESSRMKQLAEFLPPFAARQLQIQHAKLVAPKNGHAKWPQAL